MNDGATMLYVASKRDCDRCALKPRCCPKQAWRKVPRSIYEGARDMARQSQLRGRGLTFLSTGRLHGARSLALRTSS